MLPWIAVISFAVASQGYSQSQSAGNLSGASLQIYHVVIGADRPPTTRFGHDGLRIRNTRTGRDVVYNWGSMPKGRWRNLFELARGRLDAFLTVGLWQPTVELYRNEDRTLLLQRLDLPPGVSLRLALALRKNAEKGSRRYRYDVIENNCASKVRDALDHALNGEIQRQIRGPSRVGTLRDHMHRAMGRSAPADLGLSVWAVILEKDIDLPLHNRYRALSLPLELAAALREVQLLHPDGRARPLVQEEVILHEGQKQSRPDVHGWLWGPCIAFAVLFLKGRAHRRRTSFGYGVALLLWGALAGAIGVVVAIIVARSLPHGRIDASLFYFTPLHLGLLPLAWMLWRGAFLRHTGRVLGFLLALNVALSCVGILIGLLGFTEQNHVELGCIALMVGTAALIGRPAPFRDAEQELGEIGHESRRTILSKALRVAFRWRGRVPDQASCAEAAEVCADEPRNDCHVARR